MRCKKPAKIDYCSTVVGNVHRCPGDGTAVVVWSGVVWCGAVWCGLVW